MDARQLTLCLPRWNVDYAQQGGVTTISLELAKRWKEHGCEVIWVGPTPPEDYRPFVEHIEAEPTTDGLIQGIGRAQQTHTLDILVTFEPFTEGPAAARVRSLAGVPHAHVGMHFAPDDASLRDAEAETYASANVVIYQCQWFLDNYVATRFGRAFAERSSFVVVPFGVDTTTFAPNPAARSNALHPLVLFAGRLNRENCSPPEYDKGAEYLIQAIPAVLDQHQEMRVIIVGSGPQLPKLKARAEADHTDHRIEFIGELSSRSALLQLLQAASVFTLPSVCDVFPVAIVEAMAVGLPIISTTVGGIPECVDERSGILVEPKKPDLLAKAISTVLSDEALRRDMSKHARQRAVAEYDWSIAAERTLRTFYELAK